MNQRKTPKSVKKGEPGYEEYKAFMKAYMLTRYHTIRQQMVDYLGGKCAHCGSVEDLEIDHKDPALKTMQVERMCYVSKANRQDELDRCQLLCEQCHTQKTLVDLGRVPAVCGTLSGYRYCRCAACRQANSTYHKDRRDKIKRR